MVRVLSLPARFVAVFLLSAPLLAQSVPNWTAPPFWTPSKAEPTADKSLDARELAIEAEGGLVQMSSPLPVVTVTPCRIVDTRGANGPFGGPALVGNASRTFNLPSGPCAGIPSNAAAYSLNFTVIGAAGAFQGGFLTAWPTGSAQPVVSTLNFAANQLESNAAVVPAGTSGSINVFVNEPATLLIDINGYYGGGVGIDNTFLGVNAGNFTMTGSGNTGFGTRALMDNATGLGNTAVGTSALELNSTGSHNTAIGNEAGMNLTTGNDNIDIANHGVAGEENTIRIGVQGTQTATFIAGISNAAVTGVPVLVNGTSGRLGVATSSARFKDAVNDMGDASQGLMRLRPVTFRYKPELDPIGLQQYGLVAEEVAEVYPELVACDRDGHPETIRYQLLAPMLLNEVQKQEQTIEQQRQQIKDLASRLVQVEKLIASQAGSVSSDGEMARPPSQ